MNIKFLGTSFGAPSKLRHQQSLLMEIGEYSYLFDAGAPVLEILINADYDLTKIRAIFISHLHGDHMNGIFNILTLSGYYNMKFTVYISEPCVLELLKNYCNVQGISYENGEISFKIISEGCFYNDSQLKVIGIRSSHMEGTGNLSYSFLLIEGNKKICITGDLHHTLKDFPEILYYEQTEMIIVECAHFTPDQLFEKLRHSKAKTVAVIHVMPDDKYNDLHMLSKKSDFEIVFPFDGESYIL